jgi:cell division protein FtsB
MWKTQQKKDWRRWIFNAKTFFLLALVILGLLSVPLSKNLSSRYKINQEIKELEAEAKKTQGKNAELSDLISYLDSEQFVEEQARKNLNLKKAGEDLVVIKGLENLGIEKTVSDAEPSASQPVWSLPGLEKAASRQVEPSNPQRWYRYFFANH